MNYPFTPWTVSVFPQGVFVSTPRSVPRSLYLELSYSDLHATFLVFLAGPTSGCSDLKSGAFLVGSLHLLVQIQDVFIYIYHFQGWMFVYRKSEDTTCYTHKQEALHKHTHTQTHTCSRYTRIQAQAHTPTHRFAEARACLSESVGVNVCV